jgi:flagellar protein FlaJ
LLFKKKPKIINVDGKQIELQPKPGKVPHSLFGGKPKKAQPPQPAAQPQPVIQAQPAPQYQASQQQFTQAQGVARQPAPAAAAAGKPKIKKPNAWRHHIEQLAIKNRRLEQALRQQGIKESVYDFVQRMFIASIMISVVLAAVVLILFMHLGLPIAEGVVFAAVIGIVVSQVSLKAFMNFPTRKGEITSKNIERDILFASRDMIISLRSGMPLYNAIASISSGYGDASKEFAKITERVQLGQPLEDAIDQTIAETKSVSFRRLMLQASVSIKAGADVVSALQSIIDQLAQERVIELRRYGQRLNAIAMFYMLFGVILPSMGIAVVTILTTFIAIFTINSTTLEAGIVGIIFLQIVFLQLIRTSRPVFTL